MGCIALTVVSVQYSTVNPRAPPPSPPQKTSAGALVQAAARENGLGGASRCQPHSWCTIPVGVCYGYAGAGF